MNNRKQKHHIVPRFHLRAFAGSDRRLLVWDKEQGREFLAPPNTIAFQKNFYTLHLPEGPSDEAENALAQIEKMASPAFRKIREGTFPPSQEDREIISVFLALQFSRGQVSRERTNESMTQVMQQTAQLIAQFYPDSRIHSLMRDAGLETKPKDVAEARALLEEANFSTKMPSDFFVNVMFEPLLTYLPCFFERHWFLVRGANFVTSDEPIVLIGKRLGLYGPGLETADEILFAISPDLVLCLAHPETLAKTTLKREQLAELKPQAIQRIQEIFWHSARRFVYRHPSTPRPEHFKLKQ